MHIAGKQFRDNRVGRGSLELQQSLKASPGAWLPTLEIGGEVFCQSVALTRYAGRLGGKNGIIRTNYAAEIP